MSTPIRFTRIVSLAALALAAALFAVGPVSGYHAVAAAAEPAAACPASLMWDAATATCN
ncbi:hypothetical protein [Kitasatospora sp. GAS204B]|uniref:hypothetical protein n=1 Tax=unclassified Kitasatospora TaxID=2633591 RepID=UPI002474CC47|nr:hypothetical protein [Kitasatospora sp. GAS204B]MDH6117927.1 hypothetical protein [Kitasatospora sp. GAS204B]